MTPMAKRSSRTTRTARAANSKPPASQPPGWKARLSTRVKAELVGLVTGITCAFLLLALISYATTDPSWNTAAARGVPRNMGGVVGAYAADVLLQALGYAAYLVPLALGVYSARYVVLRPIAHPGWVGLGYTVLVLTTAGLLSLLMGEAPFDQLQLPAGGALGQLLSTGLARYFNVPGAGLLLGAGFLAAGMFTVNFSLFSARISLAIRRNSF